MFRNIGNQLVWNYGRLAICNRMATSTRLISTKNIVLRGYGTTDSINARHFCTKQTDPSLQISSPTSIMPKITALLNETKQFTPVSTNIIGNGKSLFRRQWEAFFNWYDEISHTNEVRLAHKQVEELQDKLNQAQQLRRDVSKELNDIRYELQMCYADQANCQKGDPRFLELIRREIQVRDISNENWHQQFEFSSVNHHYV